jgi:tetratricopeptide (TPR) repeat protein
MGGSASSKSAIPAAGAVVPPDESGAGGTPMNPQGAHPDGGSLKPEGEKCKRKPEGEKCKSAQWYRSAALVRLRDQFMILAGITDNPAKWVAVLGSLFLLAMVACRVFSNGSVQIGTVVVPKDLEDRGYTSRAVGERLHYKIDEIVRAIHTFAGKEQVVVASDSVLPDIEVPNTGLSFHSVVIFLQEVMGLQPPQVTAEITEDEAKHSLAATVSISHSRRPEVEPIFERIDRYQDPDSLISEMAQQALELIDPYVLALYFFKKRDRERTLHFVSRCDGKFAKWGWVLWGNLLLSEQNPDGAIEKYKMALALDPEFSVAYGAWGGALVAKSDHDGAIEKYRMVTYLDPNVAAAYYCLGNELINKPKPDYEQGTENYEVAIYLDPSFFPAYYNLGRALVHKHNPDYPGAIQNYERVTVLEPTFLPAYVNLGDALKDEPDPDYDGAIANFKKAMDLDPKSDYAYNDLGAAISNDGRSSGTIARFRDLTKYDPNDWSAHYILGLLEVKLGDRKSALDELQQADKLQPKNLFIHAAIQEASK